MAPVFISIARSGLVAAYGDSRRNHAYAGCVDKDLVRTSSVHHFGIAGHNLQPGLAGRFGHRDYDSLQVGERQSLFDDKAGAEPQGPPPARAEVVDRPAYGQLADVTTGEEEGADHITVGREGETDRGPGTWSIGDGDDGRVFELEEGGIVKVADKYLFHQVVAQLASGAVGQQDQVVAHGSSWPNWW